MENKRHVLNGVLGNILKYSVIFLFNNYKPIFLWSGYKIYLFIHSLSYALPKRKRLPELDGGL
jgi:hypothetical protein